MDKSIMEFEYSASGDNWFTGLVCCDDSADAVLCWDAFHPNDAVVVLVYSLLSNPVRTSCAFQKAPLSILRFKVELHLLKQPLLERIYGQLAEGLSVENW